MADLRGKVALITGASSGIGAETAVHFASLGCKLCLCGRNAANLGEISNKCVAAGVGLPDVKLVIGDITKEEVATEAVNTAISTFSRLDILVNNAGILIPGDVESTPLSVYDNIMNTNVRAVFFLTQLAIPHLKKTKGNIVNVSSIAGPRAFPGIAAYCMSKSAIDQLTRCTALEMAPFSVRVNSVNPGVIITEIHKRGGMAEEDYKKFLEHCKETHALGRPGTANEVAEAITFFASEKASSFITGAHLPIDGGRGVMSPR